MVTNTVEVKQLNVERVRKVVQKYISCTKSQVSKETHLSIATCGTILNEMVTSGEVIKIDEKETQIGRPADLFVYNGDFLHVLCVCLEFENGISTVRVAIANALGAVVSTEDHIQANLSYDTLEAIIETYVNSNKKIASIGIGLPGIITDGIVESCDIKSFKGLALSQRLSKKFGVNVLVENDMNCIIYSLYRGLPENSGDIAVIFFPKGQDSCVGCGFMINGRIHRGATMAAGEISDIISGFGIPRNVQQQMLDAPMLFHQLAAQALLTIIGTVNPAIAIFMGNDITRSDLESIYRKCREVVSERHIPTLELDNNISRNYLNGAIRLLLDSIQFSILIRQ